MRKLFIIFLLATFSVAYCGVSHNMLEIRIDSKTTVTDLQSLGMDIADIDYQAGMVHIVAAPWEEEILLNNGFSYTVVIENMEEFFASRLNQAEPMGGYHTFDEVVEAINQFHNDFPEIVGTPYSIGQSLEGREIWVVKISDNPEIDEDEPEVFYNGLIHAREPIAMEVLLYFMDYLTENYPLDPQVAYLVDNREMFFCPVINPDGYVYNETTHPNGGGMWRKNKCDNNSSGFFEEDEDGVDLNRNWGYMWGYDNIGSSPNPESATYRGTGPFSEPETEIIRDFVDSRNFTLAINYHSYSNLHIHAWGYDYLYTEDHDLFSELGWKMAEYTGYAVGPSWMNLYTVNGGANDWMYGDSTHLKLISYVTEIGNYNDNFWPPTYRIEPLCEENLGAQLVIAEYGDDPYRALPPGIPSMFPVDTVGGEFTLSWYPNLDPSNPPVGYDVAELRGWEVVTNDFEGTPGTGLFIDGFYLSSARYHSPYLSYYSGQQNSSQAVLSPAEWYCVNPGDSLKFWTWYDMEEDFDYGYVMVSLDEGYIFEPIEGNITTNYNPYGSNIGNGITGSSGGWVEAEFNLFDFTGESIFITFIYITDSYMLEEGWYIDDVFPFVQYESENILVESHPDTFLMVDPGSEPGLIYYRARAIDMEGDTSIWCQAEEVYFIGSEIGYAEIPIPFIFELTSIYPNPFNSQTVISFQISNTAETEIKVFNLLGQMVIQQDLGVLVPGVYNQRIEGGDLSGGIYFLQLNSGSNSAIRKIALIK